MGREYSDLDFAPIWPVVQQLEIEATRRWLSFYVCNHRVRADDRERWSLEHDLNPGE